VPTETRSTDYGYTSKFTGMLSLEEANDWFDDVKKTIAGKSSFGQLIDLRGQKAQSPETNQVVQDAMAYVIEHGMKRSSVVLSSTVMKMQIQRLAKEVGMYAYERYFDPSDEQWETKALAWIVDGTDPDL